MAERIPNRERRAFVCYHKDHDKDVPPGPERKFLLPGEPEPPKCSKGHVMVRQGNVRYRKK